MSLSPAEVSAHRHAMGLSLDQMAAMLGVNPRTGSLARSAFGPTMVVVCASASITVIPLPSTRPITE